MTHQHSLHAPPVSGGLSTEYASIRESVRERRSKASVDRFGRLKPLTADALAELHIRPRPEVVPGLVPGRTVTLLTGNGGDGKSLLALQLAVATVLGTTWLDRLPTQGRVVFLSAEDDLDEIHRRLADICTAEAIDLDHLGGLHILPLAGKDAVLSALDRQTGQMRPTDLWRDLRGYVAEVKPRLVILDTLADVFAGSEIDRTQARHFIGMLRGLAIEHDCAVLLLAHPSLTGMSSGSGLSGSTAWNNSVRSRLYLERLKSEEGIADPNVRTLKTVKANYGPTGGEILMRWHQGVFIRESSTSTAVPVNPAAEDAFMRLLRLFKEQGRDVSPNKGPSYAPTVFAKHPQAGGITRFAFAAAMERLLVADLIKVETFGRPSKQRQRLVPNPRPTSANW